MTQLEDELATHFSKHHGIGKPTDPDNKTYMDPNRYYLEERNTED